MTVNMGKADRLLRVLVGLGILVAGFVYGTYWGLIGLIPLLTAALGLCPLYVPLGISTCKREE